MTHDHLLKILKRLPTDHKPFGEVTEAMREAVTFADCSMGCKHFAPLEGALGADWGVCTNPASARCGLLTFEHQAGHGCFESGGRMMTNEQLKQLRALVAAETLPDAIANIVYDMIPWRGSNDPASEAHRDYMYDKGCEVADAVLAHTRPALKALLDRLDALEDVARAARNVAETDDITLTACLADIFRVPEVKAALVVHAPELHDRVLSLCTIRREGATEWHAQYVLRCIKEGDAAQATPAKT